MKFDEQTHRNNDENKLNKKHSFDNLNKTEKLKEQLKMLELVFCYMHRKIKELNKELEGKK